MLLSLWDNQQRCIFENVILALVIFSFRLAHMQGSQIHGSRICQACDARDPHSVKGVESGRGSVGYVVPDMDECFHSTAPKGWWKVRFV